MDKFSCASAHTALVRYVDAIVSRNTKLDADTTLLARLGMSCVSKSTQRALVGQTEAVALHAWAACGLGEAQLRDAVFKGFRAGGIGVAQFDHAFGLMKTAAQLRTRERIRLRQRILYHVY